MRLRRRWCGGAVRWVRLLPLFCVFVIVAALGILAISEISLVQRRSGIVGGGGGSATRILPPRPQHAVTRVTSRQVASGTAFKIEPLLRRNAPSVELSAQVALNAGRAAFLAKLIAWESQPASWKMDRPLLCGQPLDYCPPVPPNLNGRMNVSSAPLGMSEEQVVGALGGEVGDGGNWSPLMCAARHRVAIVVPYRDRRQQLLTLLYHLHPLLQRQQISYRLYLVEQMGNETFNKGVLMNAAFLTIVGMGEQFNCFVFHDVDMLPEDDRNMYTCPAQPRHMSVAVNELDYRLPYRELVGGVFAIRTEHFFKVNGYSNLFWGWGGEDDDMGNRVEHILSAISRPPEWIARYTMIRHEKRKPLAWKVRSKLLRTWRRYRLDGLNTVQYCLVGITRHHLYTQLLVDVGQPPHNIRVVQQEQDNDDEKRVAEEKEKT